jgi:adenine-specific DNA-methyltransferase
MVFILSKDKSGKSFEFRYTKLQEKQINVSLIGEVLKNIRSEIDYESFRTELDRSSGSKIINFIDKDTLSVLNHISNQTEIRLGKNEVGTGIDVHQDFVTDKHLQILKNSQISKGDGIFAISNKEKEEIDFDTNELSEVIKPYYTSEELHRFYGEQANNYWVIYTDRERREKINSYPNIKRHLDKYTKVITSDTAPYGLHRARDEKFFTGNKIMSLRKTLRGQFTYTDFPCYVSQSYFVIKPESTDMKYLTGLLNSQLVYFWLYHKGKKQGEQLQVDKAPLLEIPIVYKEQDPATKQIIELVDKQIATYKALDGEQSESKKQLLQNQIDSNDRKINQLVYKLYGLTQKEIAVIEGGDE